MGAGDPFDILFGNSNTRKAGRFFVKWLKDNGNRASAGHVSKLADLLSEGGFFGDPGAEVQIRYSRRNFYGTLLKTLVDLGFISRGVPVWNDRQKRTNWVYQLNVFDIPAKPPAVGFWRLAWYICKKWNRLLEGSQV